MINKIFDFLSSTYLGGSLFILIGMLTLLYIKFNPKDANSWRRPDIKGLAAAIFFIVAGIGVIISKIINLN